MNANKPTLTLGPVLYLWEGEKWRDFYFRIADEAPVSHVVIGETVCSKRLHFTDPYFAPVIERLVAAGKRIVLSTLALVTLERESQYVRSLIADSPYPVEANDLSALALLEREPHWIGPLVMPLAISARCAHARAKGHIKDNCQFVCKDDPDGLPVNTLDRQSFLALNGVQTISFTCQALLAELSGLVGRRVSRFRLSPQDCDMVSVARLYDEVLHGRLDAEDGLARLRQIYPTAPFSNGFHHGQEGPPGSPAHATLHTEQTHESEGLLIRNRIDVRTSKRGNQPRSRPHAWRGPEQRRRL